MKVVEVAYLFKFFYVVQIHNFVVLSHDKIYHNFILI